MLILKISAYGEPRIHILIFSHLKSFFDETSPKGRI
jgi:hypothetical protein